MRLSVVSIPVSDVDAAKRFYVEQVGFAEVDDVPATRDELLGRGVEVGDVDEKPWGTFATFGDPDGNRWVLSRPAAGA